MHLLKTHKTTLILALLSTAFIIQIAISHQLWFTATREFPLIPAFSFIPLKLGATVASVLAIILCAALAGILIKRIQKIAFITMLATLAILVLEDISRLQPWVFLNVMMIIPLVAIPKVREANAIKLTKITLGLIYLWSGLHKLNPGFQYSIFPFLMDAFDAKVAALQSSWWIAAPIGEIAVGLAMLWRKTFKLGAVMAVGMHLFIMVCVGPFGLDFNHVIWPWNIALIIVLIVLILIHDKHEHFEGKSIHFEKAGIVVLLFVGLGPFLNFFNLWDDPISGSLYSGTASQAVFFFPGQDMDFAEGEKTEFAYYNEYTDQSYIDLDRWSYGTLQVPFYSAPRYYKALGCKMCEEYAKKPDETGIRLINKTTFTAERDTVIISCSVLTQ